MYRGLLLDVYGTLVHEDNDVLAPICHRVAELAGVTAQDVAGQWWRLFREATTASTGTAFRRQRDLSRDTLAQTMRVLGVDGDAAALCAGQFAFWRRPPVFADSVAFLREVHLPVCIVSNIDTDDVLAALDHHHLTGLVTSVVTSEDARAYKPRPEPFELALTRLRLDPRDVLHIGDSPSADLQGAAALGIDTAWVNRTGRTLPDDHRPTITVTSLRDLEPLLGT